MSWINADYEFYFKQLIFGVYVNKNDRNVK